jgi:hypothetical protein
MSTENEASYYLDRLREAWDAPDIDTPLGQAVARLKVPFVLGDGKRWYYERFVCFLSALRQALAAIDDSISPDLPPFMLEPAAIAKLFRIPLEDFNWQGGPPDARAISDSLSTIQQQLDGKLGQITDLIVRQGTSPVSPLSGQEAALTREEVARRFQITTRTLDHWRSMGIDLGEININGTPRFSPETIANIIATQKVRRRRTRP